MVTDEHIQVYHLIEYISQIEVFQLNANIKCSSLVEYIFNYHGREVDNEEICEDEKFSTNISFYKYKSKFKGTKFMYDEYIKHYNDSFKGAKFIIYDNSKSYLHLSLDSFEINDLENSEIEKLVDEYKDFTGNYYYNTKYYYKEDIFKEFKQKYKRFTLVILTKYNINDNVIILDKPTYNSKTS